MDDETEESVPEIVEIPANQISQFPISNSPQGLSTGFIGFRDISGLFVCGTENSFMVCYTMKIAGIPAAYWTRNNQTSNILRARSFAAAVPYRTDAAVSETWLITGGVDYSTGQAEVLNVSEIVSFDGVTTGPSLPEVRS